MGYITHLIHNIKDMPIWYIQMFGNPLLKQESITDMCYDDCDEWIVVTDDINQDNIMGFSGYKIKNQTMHLVRAYVFTQYRLTNILTDMLDLRIQLAHKNKCRKIKTVITKHALSAYTKRDFSIVSETKNYMNLERIL